MYLKRLSFAVPENQQKNLPENQEHRIHRMQNCVHFFFRYKSYEYQLLQGAATQDKDVCYTWRCYILSKPGDDKHAKILFSDVDTSISPGTLTDITLTHWHTTFYNTWRTYIYIYIYMERLFLMFLDHTQRRSKVGRTPLDE